MNYSEIWSFDCLSPAKEIVDAIIAAENLHIFELKGNTLGVESARVIGDALKRHPEFKVIWDGLFPQIRVTSRTASRVLTVGQVVYRQVGNLHLPTI